MLLRIHLQNKQYYCHTEGGYISPLKTGEFYSLKQRQKEDRPGKPQLILTAGTDNSY